MDVARRIRELLKGGSYSIKRASALLAVAALASNVLGLARDVIFYWLFPKEQLDVYFAAFRLPDLIFNVLILGAVSSAFVPIASELLEKNQEKEANELTNQLLSWLTLVFTGIAILLAVFMRPLMEIVVQGFDSVRTDQAVLLSRILLLQSVFFAWSFTIGGYLNSAKRFLGYALAPLVYNAVIIVGGFIGARYGIEAAAWAVVAGSFGHFAIQYNELRKTSYRPKFDLTPSRRLKDISQLMAPRSISQGISQIVNIVYTNLASGLVASSIAILNGINNIQTMPVQIVGNSLAVAMFPTLSAHIAKKDWAAANALLAKTFRSALYILIPGIVFAFIVRAQLVRLYLGIGHSNWEQTTLGIDTFVAFLFGIIPACFIALLSRVFYALKDTRTPMALSGIAAAVGILYASYSIKGGGSVVNLAISSSILSTVQFILYALSLYKNQDIKLGARAMAKNVAAYCFTAILVGIAAWGTLNLVDLAYSATDLLGTRTILGLFLQLIAAGLVGATVFLQYSKQVHKEELQWILRKNFSGEK